MMMDISGQSQKWYDYIHALEEEKKKIQMFQRELPLCLQLVTQAIENVRQKMMCDDASPVVADFLCLKPSLSWSENEDGSVHADEKSPASSPNDWLKSVQLWNQEHEDTAPKMMAPKKPIVVNATKTCGAFQPFEREKHGVAHTRSPSTALPSDAAAASSSTSIGGGDGSGSNENENIDKNDQKEKEKKKDGQVQSQSQIQANRKSRRSWAPELHRRFLQAIQQLGGSHAATPKQIRELMNVDGLTNDEVKSHLQKYRLHTRRPSPQVQNNSSSNPPTPQFVVIGGIWVPPPDYAVVAAAAVAQPINPTCVPNEIYAPVASHPPKDTRFQQNKKQTHSSPTGPLASDRCSDDDNSLRDVDDDAANFVSPTNSSSSSQNTTSPSS